MSPFPHSFCSDYSPWKTLQVETFSGRLLLRHFSRSRTHSSGPPVGRTSRCTKGNLFLAFVQKFYWRTFLVIVHLRSAQPLRDGEWIHSFAERLHKLHHVSSNFRAVELEQGEQILTLNLQGKKTTFLCPFTDARSSHTPKFCQSSRRIDRTDLLAKLSWRSRNHPRHTLAYCRQVSYRFNAFVRHFAKPLLNVANYCASI
ncbi:hypothetical protein BG28_09525 [Nesterenkonia sp. AN1]|nr:hypothetical protein BG28_09525 [Nesterenkonia sp. AN1]